MSRSKILKIKYMNAKINDVKSEISSITNLATNPSISAKINEFKGEIPNITTTAVTTVENKIPNVSNLVKKTDYNTKISKIENKIATDHNHDKYITAQEFNKVTSESFTVRLKQANLASKNDIANFVNKTDFDNKLKDVTSNKNELNELSKKVKAISTKRLKKDLNNKFSIPNGAKCFSSGIFQNCFVFIPSKRYIKYFSGTTQIESWKSNGISEENIKNITKSDNNFAPTLVDHHLLPDMSFNGHCLINNFYIPKKVINLYISYTLGPQLRNSNTDFTLGNGLFGPVNLTKNADLDKNKYSGYGIGFDSRSELSLPHGILGKHFIIFGADMSLFVHVDNKGKDILILGERPTQGLGNTTLTSEAKYPVNFTQSGKRFVLRLHYNGSNSFLFVNATKVYQFKARNSEIKDYVQCLGNISKDFKINNMKKAGLKGLVKIFFC